MRQTMALAAYIVLALLIAAIGGGWIGLHRIDPALVVPGLGWATALAACVRPPKNWRAALSWSLVLLVLTAALTLALAINGVPWLQLAFLLLVSGALNLAAMAIAHLSIWPHLRRMQRRFALVILIGAAGIGIQQFGWRLLPSLYAAPVLAAKPSVSLIAGVPLYHGEQTVAANLAGARHAIPALAELQRHARLSVQDALIDSAPGAVLLLIHPKALEPQQLVAIDAHVRNGGSAIVLADGLSSWPPPFQAGDRRNPDITSLLTPLLQHWGLVLDAPIGLEEKRVTITDLGERITFYSPGTLRAENNNCHIRAEGVIALCRLGQGQALVIADADWLDAQYWHGPLGGEPVGQSAGNISWLVQRIYELAQGASLNTSALFKPVWVG